jgi:ATP-dependent RNA helicase RhlE
VYVHRIGRTGRVGRDGKAISLVTRREQAKLDAIRRLTGQQIPLWTAPGEEPEAEPTATPAEQAEAPVVQAAAVTESPSADGTEARRRRRGRRGGRGRRPGGQAATASAD